MKKKSKVKANAPKIDPYVEGFMSKLLDRLVSLEKKMDSVLSQVSGKQGQTPAAPPQPKRDRVLYEAICADCNKVCEVPFQPSETRAVYCKTCFALRKSGQKPALNARPGMPVLTPVAMPTTFAKTAAPVPVKKAAISKKAKAKKKK